MLERKRFSAVVVGAVLLSLGMIAQAAHDDSNLRNLTVTVSVVSGGDVTIDIAGSGYDSSELPAIRLGSQFYYDAGSPPGPGDLRTWVNPVPPAIDWGDGNIVANTGIPFTGTATTSGSSSSSSGILRTFSSQFMHTYAAPGNYTVRVFGTNIYAASTSSSSGYIVNGTYSVSTPVMRFRSITSTSGGGYSTTGTSTSSRGSGAQPIGILKSATVNISSVGAPPPASPRTALPPEPVPTMTSWAMILLGILLAGAGFVTLRRT